jgi:hypothetical protein
VTRDPGNFTIKDMPLLGRQRFHVAARRAGVPISTLLEWVFKEIAEKGVPIVTACDEETLRTRIAEAFLRARGVEHDA